MPVFFNQVAGFIGLLVVVSLQAPYIAIPGVGSIVDDFLRSKAFSIKDVKIFLLGIGDITVSEVSK